jgi:hypothetical protein
MFTMIVCSICNRRNKCTTVDIKPSSYLSCRENRMGNQELTIQGHWQHWPHKTQNEDNKKNINNNNIINNDNTQQQQQPQHNTYN